MVGFYQKIEYETEKNRTCDAPKPPQNHTSPPRIHMWTYMWMDGSRCFQTRKGVDYTLTAVSIKKNRPNSTNQRRQPLKVAVSLFPPYTESRTYYILFPTTPIQTHTRPDPLSCNGCDDLTSTIFNVLYGWNSRAPTRLPHTKIREIRRDDAFFIKTSPLPTPHNTTPSQR